MKISNYMNNANPIMEANANKVQKENSQTNEKNTVGQSVKLSISNEGLEYYRKCIQQSGQEKYDDVVQRKELLASKKISDIDYSCNGDTTRCSDVYNNLYRKMQKKDRLTAGYTLKKYERIYRQAFYDAAKRLILIGKLVSQSKMVR